MHQLNFLFSPAAEALGHTLLSSLGQSFVIFICLRIVLKLIPNVSSQIKYALAYCAYLAIGGWFIITLIRQYSIAQTEATIQQVINVSVFYSTPFNSATNSFNIFSLSFLNEYLPLIVAFYLIGFFWYSLRLSINFFQTNQLKSTALFDLDPEWQQHIFNLARRMNIRRPLQTFFSARVNTPLMIGFFKPVILLPLTTLNHLSAEQFEAILLHELAHIRRNDYVLNLLQSALDILMFFNPFTWWISRYIREEREKSCDEMVLQFSDPFHYARALLSLEEPRINQAIIMTAVGKRSHLFHRIKNIMEMKKNHLNLRQKFITLLVIGIATISVAWLSPEKNNAIHSDKSIINSGTSIAAQAPAIFTFLNFNSPVDTLMPTPPKSQEPPSFPQPPIAPTPPVAFFVNGSSVLALLPPLPPVAPLAPLPPAAPLPPIGSPKGITDSLPFPAEFFKSKEWKQQQEAIKKSTEEMRKYFQSDAWKKQQDLMKENAMVMKKYFDSPELKKLQEEIQKSASKVHEYFNSPEWKKQHELIQKSADSMAHYIKSDAWKKQMEDMQKSFAQTQKYFQSDDWKKEQAELKAKIQKQQADFQKLEELKKMTQEQKDAQKEEQKK